MLLKNLINKIPNHLKGLSVKGLEINSKKVKKGFIFFAIKGKKFNGENFIDNAIQNGASLIICSKKCKFKSKNKNIVKTGNITKLLIKIAKKFYKQKPKNIIAVTGTNGKTSVSDYFFQILKNNRIPVGSIGTLGIKYKNTVIKTDLTTPDIITIHKNLELIKNKKIDNVIIEASSHGLTQNRLEGLEFKAGIFTNLSQDHLDYHRSMKKYLNAKLILFKKLLKKRKFLITDSQIKEFPILKKISKIRGLKLLDIKDQNKIINDTLPIFIGSFQLKNLAMAVQAAKLCNLSTKQIYNTLKNIRDIEGRLNLVKKFPNNIKVFVDFAHTPEALREVLSSLKKFYKGNISIVFGCGGERDKKKRPIMAKVAKTFCNKIYVTDDNPRNENPKKIREEIIKNLKNKDYFNIGNRSDAIKKSILNADPNEIVLIAGKGHENYQDYGKKVISVSDKAIIKNLKYNKRLISKDEQISLFNSKILNEIIRNKTRYHFNGLAIDSRDTKKGNIFLAIKGKNKDGNLFIANALKKGAEFIISSKRNTRYKNKIIKVSNPISFLNKFAALKRKKTSATILAITGSAGKTSLKNMLNHLLMNYGKTFASPKSFNNHYGVPLSLSNLNLNHKFGVFEIGMNKAGEIEKLSKLVKPNLAVITNVADAHIENFKNTKGIAKAKGEILNNIIKGGTVILNKDDRFFNYFYNKAKIKKLNIFTFGKSKNADVRLTKIIENNNSRILQVNIGKRIMNLKIKDINIYNVLASIAVLKSLNLNLENNINLFSNLRPTEGRGKIYQVKRYSRNFKLIDESYNSNPLSVKIALNNYSRIKKVNFKKYLLLGDMLELGKKSMFHHKNVSKLINSSDIDKVFVKGEKSIFTYKYLKKAKRGNILQTNEDVDSILKNIISNNDYLMIKGSNATGLNNISKTMIKGI